MRRVTHREALCGPVMHTIFDKWHCEVLRPCVWTRTVLYQLYMMTRNCARFHEMRERQRSDAWGQFVLTCNAMERGRAGEMVHQVKYFLHIKLWITGEPGLIPLVKNFVQIQLWIAGKPPLMPMVKYCLHIELWIMLVRVPNHHVGSGSGSKPNYCQIGSLDCQ
jgi:hypothetical protein